VIKALTGLRRKCYFCYPISEFWACRRVEELKDGPVVATQRSWSRCWP